MSDFQFPRVHLIYFFAFLVSPPREEMKRWHRLATTTYSGRAGGGGGGGQREMAGSRRRSRRGEAARRWTARNPFSPFVNHPRSFQNQLALLSCLIERNYFVISSCDIKLFPFCSDMWKVMQMSRSLNTAWNPPPHPKKKNRYDGNSLLRMSWVRWRGFKEGNILIALVESQEVLLHDLKTKTTTRNLIASTVGFETWTSIFRNATISETRFVNAYP